MTCAPGVMNMANSCQATISQEYRRFNAQTNRRPRLQHVLHSNSATSSIMTHTKAGPSCHWRVLHASHSFHTPTSFSKRNRTLAHWDHAGSTSNSIGRTNSPFFGHKADVVEEFLKPCARSLPHVLTPPSPFSILERPISIVAETFPIMWNCRVYAQLLASDPNISFDPTSWSNSLNQFLDHKSELLGRD